MDLRMRPKYVTVAHATATRVAERWKAQYTAQDGTWRSKALINKKNPETIYDELLALGETPDIAEVARIIGNQSWSYLTCSGCNEYVATAVEFTDSWQERKPILCSTCINEAVTVLNRKDL